MSARKIHPDWDYQEVYLKACDAIAYLERLARYLLRGQDKNDRLDKLIDDINAALFRLGTATVDFSFDNAIKCLIGNLSKQQLSQLRSYLDELLEVE